MRLYYVENLMYRGQVHRRYNVRTYRRLSNSENSIAIFNDDSSLAGYESRVIEDGGIVEALSCAEAEFNFSEDFYNTCNNEYNTTTGKYTAIDSNRMSFQGVFNFDLLYTDTNTNTTNKLNYFHQSSKVLPYSLSVYLNAYLIQEINGVYTIADTFKCRRYRANKKQYAR